jgi:uncharacterized protein
MMAATLTDRRQLFDLLADPATIGRFFDHVAEDVSWTIMGAHPLAGTYHGKDLVRTATLGRLNLLMRDRLRLTVRRLHVAGVVVAAELNVSGTAIDGRPFQANYCWVCRFDGDTIVEVNAYVDSALIADTIARAEPLADPLADPLIEPDAERLVGTLAERD